MKQVNKPSNMSSDKFENDPEYRMFVYNYSKALNVLNTMRLKSPESELGSELFCEMFKHLIKSKSEILGSDFLDKTLLSKESLEVAVRKYFNTTFNQIDNKGFLILLPVALDPNALEPKVILTLVLADYSGEEVLLGESKGTRLLDMVPSQFKEHAYGLSFTKDANGEDLNLYDNLNVQLNYYRRIFGLEDTDLS